MGKRLLSIVALLSLLPRGAAAAAAPDSVLLARLDTAATAQNRFRVTTNSGSFLLKSLRVDEGGVFLAPARPALIVTSDAPAAPRHASWSEITRIDGRRSSSLRGAAIGGLIGAAVGLGAQQAFRGSLHDASGVAILAIPIGALLGAGMGAVSGSNSRWRVLYP